ASVVRHAVDPLLGADIEPLAVDREAEWVGDLAREGVALAVAQDADLIRAALRHDDVAVRRLDHVARIVDAGGVDGDVEAWREVELRVRGPLARPRRIRGAGRRIRRRQLVDAD